MFADQSVRIDVESGHTTLLTLVYIKVSQGKVMIRPGVASCVNAIRVRRTGVNHAGRKKT